MNRNLGDDAGMRILLAATLLLPLLARPASAAKPMKATMLCGVFKNKKVDYLVPTEDGRKLSKPIDCAIQIESGGKGTMTAHAWIETAGEHSEDHAEAIAKGNDFETEFKPNADFRACTNFEIHARIEGDGGTLWQDVQKVTQTCSAGAAAPTAATPAAPVKATKVKATFECKKILKDQSAWAIGNEGYRIDAVRLDCTVRSKDSRLVGGRAFIKTTWHKGTILQQGNERGGSPIAEGGDYEYMFTLEKGSDWDTCATDITVPVTVLDPNGQTVFQAEKLYRQNCQPIPVAPPVGSKKPPADSGAKWDETALKQIPADAQSLAQQFIDAAVDSDPPTLASLAQKGVKKGKKTLVGKDVYDLGAATGIKPSKECDEQQQNCKWGPWAAMSKSPTEFWIYSTNDSGYGKFACAVFTKGPSGWAWTGVRSYDTGEP